MHHQLKATSTAAASRPSPQMLSQHGGGFRGQTPETPQKLKSHHASSNHRHKKPLALNTPPVGSAAQQLPMAAVVRWARPHVQLLSSCPWQRLVAGWALTCRP